ncbi:HAD family hydrolase [Pseudonocardia cypriaca]|uniref:Putative hydrolase of the HAD superfamily n=1 Tax=Pseudonocardia cypriaca TaxID=882449 RepID=A0A543FPQ8_9PSEU|nr:HAD family hydrolase [Pseudonocardia cypriaca]TQM35828.1 putative hydrolase of the HAD superfamily [Pseudonocardia cypriaca]
MPTDRQTLVFDADDTLWENNVLFERVIDAYLDWLAHPTLDRAATRAVLDEVERANVVVHGYGTASFLRSLHDCFERLSERPAGPAEAREIEELAAALVSHEVELVPGVAETLTELGGRHDLMMLTKGDPAEQQRKIDASGLAHHFASVHIVAEKHAGAYRSLVAEQGLVPDATWMIGNSPRSDILPARAAGLNAVFIPNQHTWVLEHDELDPTDEGVLHLEHFRALTEHF